MTTSLLHLINLMATSLEIRHTTSRFSTEVQPHMVALPLILKEGPEQMLEKTILEGSNISSMEMVNGTHSLKSPLSQHGEGDTQVLRFSGSLRSPDLPETVMRLWTAEQVPHMVGELGRILGSKAEDDNVLFT